jgi:hypothetical protein
MRSHDVVIFELIDLDNALVLHARMAARQPGGIAGKLRSATGRTSAVGSGIFNLAAAAIDMGRRLAPAGLYWIEDPTIPDDHPGLAASTPHSTSLSWPANTASACGQSATFSKCARSTSS